jgi:hypothetical protein
MLLLAPIEWYILILGVYLESNKRASEQARGRRKAEKQKRVPNISKNMEQKMDF